ncbi:syntaxin-112-like [Durio zibethinus]|uniref:Syntaxin-112-like n=1 Tax=Durio zibethinus TaxID=66656 RepID=A0A6P5XBT6_DURZI|nr:syntaxin-112-like [Durio zibethinus]
MNDLMTKSFLSYVELKKQALKDIEEEADLEMGQFDPTYEQNLSKFFEDVTLIENDMEEITNLLLDLQDLKQEAKTTDSAKVVRGIRDRINSDMVTVLQKARNIKSRLESLDHSNIENRNVSMEFKEGSHVDRTRVSVTNGLRVKLREMMIDFQSLREHIVEEHKQEGQKKSYSNVTGEEPSEEMIEKVFEGKSEMVLENSERQEALKEIQRSLTELHHLFLDMAVLVETQGDNINDIEYNVDQAGIQINGGTNGLFYAKQMNKTRTWACWIAALVLVLLLVLFHIMATHIHDNVVKIFVTFTNIISKNSLSKWLLKQFPLSIFTANFIMGTCTRDKHVKSELNQKSVDLKDSDGATDQSEKVYVIKQKRDWVYILHMLDSVDGSLLGSVRHQFHCFQGKASGAESAGILDHFEAFD